MREILFRAKRKDNGEWVYGDLLHPDLYGNGYAIEDFTKGKNNCFDIDENTICEYTNWKNKNGTKIFEGDIIRYDYGFGVVTWVRSTGAFMCVEENGLFLEWFENIFARSVEVIGNKFDNPELLEK